MRKNIQYKIRHLENKRKYEKILESKRRVKINEYAETGLFSAIGDALGDIFKSLKLTAMDISNELRFLGEKFLYRNNPEKLKKAHDGYNRKRDKILKNWEPIVAGNMEVLKNADPFLTILLAPNVYLASKSIQAGVAAGKTATEIIAAEDWESIRAKINKFQIGTDDNPNAGVELGIGAVHDQMAKQNNLLLQLNNLFMSDRKEKEKQKKQEEDKTKKESDLREQEGDQQQGKITDPNKWLETFFKITGIDDEFTIAAFELLKDKKELAEEMIDSIVSSTAIMKLILATKPEEFAKTIDEVIKNADIPAEAMDPLKDVFPSIKEQAKKLSQSAEFRKEIADATNKNIQELSDAEVEDKAMQVVFKQSKQKFDQQYTKDVEAFSKVIDNNHKDIDTDNETLALIKKRKGDIPTAGEFIEVYEKYAKAYKEYDKTRKVFR